MSFYDNDNNFSKHKDFLLTDYFEKISYREKSIIVNSKLLQQTHGIDVICQKNIGNEFSIDTKHIRGGPYDKLFIEELSCSNKGRESFGWLLSDKSHPDYIMHVFNWWCGKLCRNHSWCENCNKSTKTIRDAMVAYITPFEKLINWYRPLYHSGEIEKYCVGGLHTESTANKTTGRNIPIKTLIKYAGTKKCNL